MVIVPISKEHLQDVKPRTLLSLNERAFQTFSQLHTLIKESYPDVGNPDQLRVLAFSTLP